VETGGDNEGLTTTEGEKRKKGIGGRRRDRENGRGRVLPDQCQTGCCAHLLNVILLQNLK